MAQIDKTTAVEEDAATSATPRAIFERLSILGDLARELDERSVIEPAAALCLQSICGAGPWSSGHFELTSDETGPSRCPEISIRHPRGSAECGASGPWTSCSARIDGIATLAFHHEGSASVDPADEVVINVAAMLLGRVIERSRLIRDREKTEADRARRWTLLKQSEDAMRERHARLHTAINNMSQGLAMYDGDGKLVLCNDLYATMYRLTAAEVRPGTRLQHIADRRRANGFDIMDIVEDGAFETHGALALKNECRTWRLGDGRRILVSVQPLWNGGWVTSHEDTTERQSFEDRISHLAHHDALTDLANRILFRERLDRALADAVRGGDRFAVLWLDLDRFKLINDTMGHIMGDLVLQAVAKRLRGYVRDSDLVARLGGDEFALLQVPVTSQADADALARRIHAVVSAPFQVEGQRISLDTSIGICMAPDDANDADQMLLNADIALYGAKADGRNTHRFFKPGMADAIQSRRQLEVALRKALDDDAFELHYQPIVDLNTDAIVTCEALLRWCHPELGPISPNVFIPVAEEVGLMARLGRWVLARACTDAAGWPNGVAVAVNVSPSHVTSKQLTTDVVQALATSGLPPARLEVEITEAVLMQHTDSAPHALGDLRARGVKLAIDDFGTGYSSLSYLGRFPFSKIKIDRSFIAGLPDDRSSRVIVKAITSLADGLGVITTAEGVETDSQLAAVLALGCTQVQGFLFSKPVNNPALLQLFAKRAEDATPRAGARPRPRGAKSGKAISSRQDTDCLRHVRQRDPATALTG